MRERRFREAFALSIYKPAIDGLSAAEFEELRPDFEKMAAAIPEKIDISGEERIIGRMRVDKQTEADRASCEAASQSSTKPK